MIAIYQKQLGATVGELAVVGDFEQEATLSQVSLILKDWKSDVPVKRIERSAPGTIAGFTENILTPDKADATFRAGLTFPMKKTDADFAALRLGNLMLGGNTLSSRLGNRIRQKEGLTYGVTSSLTSSPRDPVTTFIVSATTNLLNIDRVEKAVIEELNLFLTKGPSPEELADAQKAFLEASKVGRTGDAAIAGAIATNPKTGPQVFRTPASMEKRIAALTPDEVKAAFGKYIDPKKLVIIRAGDFKK